MPTVLSALQGPSSNYQVTADDVLWLRRAVEAEGEPRRAVARALVNLFVLRMQGSPSKPQSLAALVRAYAQPVNPRWFEGGDLYEAAVKRAEPGKRDVMRMAARRRETLHSARTVFSEGTDRAVVEALGGMHPEDVTDYAAPGVDGTAKGYVARSPQEAGKNRLWTRRPGWGGYVASAAASERQDGFAEWGPLAVAVAGGLLYALCVWATK